MGKIRASNAWKKIFRPAGETRDLMRHGGAEDYDGIVNSGSQTAIEIDRNSVGDQPASQFRNSCSGQFADSHEFLRNVPLVIVDVAESRH